MHSILNFSKSLFLLKEIIVYVNDSIYINYYSSFIYVDWIFSYDFETRIFTSESDMYGFNLDSENPNIWNGLIFL